MFGNTRLNGILFVSACLMGTSLNATAEPDLSDAPAWYSESKKEIESDPVRVALSYLRLMEEGWYEVAYTLLTDTHAKLQGNDASAFAKDVKGKKDWHTYADSVHAVKLIADGQQRVSIQSFVDHEGYSTRGIIEFELMQVEGRWLIEQMEWAESADVEPPLRELRFNKDAVAAKNVGEVSSAFRKATRTPSTTAEQTVATEAAPWLSRSDWSDTKAVGAVNGYVRAVAFSRPLWARYYLQAETPSGTREENGTDSNARIYDVGDDEHETEVIDDSHCVVWRPVWFSVGSQLYVQAMAFDCVKSDGRWKIVGSTEGPKREQSGPEKAIPTAP